MALNFSQIYLRLSILPFIWSCYISADQCQGNPLLVYRVDTGVNPKGYTQPSEDVSKNYADAQAQCQAQGMQLMMSKTEDEYLMMLDITSRNGKLLLKTSRWNVMKVRH